MARHEGLVLVVCGWWLLELCVGQSASCENQTSSLIPPRFRQSTASLAEDFDRHEFVDPGKSTQLCCASGRSRDRDHAADLSVVRRRGCSERIVETAAHDIQNDANDKNESPNHHDVLMLSLDAFIQPQIRVQSPQVTIPMMP